MNWIAAGAIAGPIIAALALYLATREKKVDALAEATRAGFEGMVSLTDNQREELDRYRAEMAATRVELDACERNRELDRKSLDAALLLVGELKAKVEALEKQAAP